VIHIFVIAVDFDSTLNIKGKPNKKLIEKLIESRENGDKIILWTCREGDSLDYAVEFCCDNGLEFDSINDNIEDSKYSSRKIYADVYIDDKSVSPSYFALAWK